MKKYFFGWENIKWVIREFFKVGSHEESFFSQKRFHMLIAFSVLQWGCIHYLLINVKGMSGSDFFLWAAVEGTLCGYTLAKIEDAKKAISEITITKETTTNSDKI